MSSELQDSIHATAMNALEQGKRVERVRILNILADDEWHEWQRLPGTTGETDLQHISGFCWACQLIEQISEVKA
jgi:hypothetical protein